MIRINLLPYREENRQIRRKQFYTFLGVVVAIAVALVVAVYMLLDLRVQAQEDRNRFLSTKISDLEKQIQEVAALKQEIAGLIERKNTIESLQEDRSETIYLLSEMVEKVPGGIYLTTLTQKNKTVTLTGYTQSSSRVSTLMKNIEDSSWMEAPRLNEIRAVMVAGRPLGAFSLQFRLVKEKQAPAPAAGEKPAEATDKGGQQ